MLILGHEWWSYWRQLVVENCESTGRNGHHLPSAGICKCFFPNHYELPENLCQSWNWMLLCFLPVRTPYTSNLEGTVFCGNPGVHGILLPSLRWHFRHGEWDLRVCPGSPGEGRFIWLDRCMLSRNKTSSMGSGHLHSNLECLRIACLLSHKEARSLKHQGVQISIGGNRICSRHFQLTYLTRWKSRAGNTQLSGYIIWHLFACVFEALVSDLWRPCGPCTFWILFHLRDGFLPLLWKLEVKWIHRFCSAFF